MEALHPEEILHSFVKYTNEEAYKERKTLP